MSKKISFDVSSAEIVRNEDQFAIARIHAFSSGENRHELICDVDTLKKTAHTIYEKPIVFDYDRTFGDFGGHIDDPIIAGFVVPDSAEFIELPDGRVGLTVMAKIWKLYSKNFMEIFEKEGTDNKKVSVEMLLEESEEDSSSSFSKMVDFIYTAICVLGTFVTEASPGANIKILSFSEKKNKERYFIEKFAKYEDIDFIIPDDVKKNAKEGLELREKLGGGTAVGVSTAKYLLRNEKIEPKKIRQMSKYMTSYSKRDLSDKKSKEYVNWKLFGGGSGFKWSCDIASQMDEFDSQVSVYFEEEVMPYKSLKDINSALKGIKPPISLSQANQIAKQADAIGTDKEKNGWAIAISNFKKTHKVKDGKWVKKEEGKKMAVENKDMEVPKEEEMAAEEEAPKEEEMASEEAPEEEEMAAEEAPKEEMSEEEAPKEEEMAEDEPESEDEEESEDEPEEEMSNEYARVGEAMKMLSEDADYKTIMEKYESKEFGFVEVIEAMAQKVTEMNSEMFELKQFKADVEDREFSLHINSTLKEVDGILPDAEVATLKENANNYSLETVDVWKNLVRAKAFEFSKGTSKDDGIVRYPLFDASKGKKKSLWSKKK